MVDQQPRSAHAADVPPSGEDAARVLRRFRQVFNAVKTHFQRVERQAGIGGAQLWALSVVQARPGLGTSELARAMDVHQSTASNLVKALAQAGLLEVRREGADRRAVQLHLRPAGQAVLAAAPGPFAGVLPEALSQLDRETLQRLDHDLGRLLALLGPDRRAQRIPLAQM